MFRKEVLQAVMMMQGGSVLSEEAAAAAYSSEIENFISKLIRRASSRQTESEGSPIDLEESLMRDLDSSLAAEPVHISVEDINEARNSFSEY